MSHGGDHQEAASDNDRPSVDVRPRSGESLQTHDIGNEDEANANAALGPRSGSPLSSASPSSRGAATTQRGRVGVQPSSNMSADGLRAGALAQPQSEAGVSSRGSVDGMIHVTAANVDSQLHGRDGRGSAELQVATPAPDIPASVSADMNQGLTNNSAVTFDVWRALSSVSSMGGEDRRDSARGTLSTWRGSCADANANARGGGHIQCTARRGSHPREGSRERLYDVANGVQPFHTQRNPSQVTVYPHRLAAGWGSDTERNIERVWQQGERGRASEATDGIGMRDPHALTSPTGPGTDEHVGRYTCPPAEEQRATGGFKGRLQNSEAMMSGDSVEETENNVEYVRLCAQGPLGTESEMASGNSGGCMQGAVGGNDNVVEAGPKRCWGCGRAKTPANCGWLCTGPSCMRWACSGCAGKGWMFKVVMCCSCVENEECRCHK